ncbi:alanine racemase [Deferribacter thermophilus]|uniref:alanine racemase n=1 Tax=Deferribacter thermophilus TaxID=53573 RepID=UPI003C2507CD
MLTKIKTLRPTYAEINLANYKHNIEIAKSLSKSKIIAIVKADAYGHGAIRLSKHAYEQCGIKDFGVATIEEGVSLRQNLPFEARIITLGYIDEHHFDELIQYKITPTIFDENIMSKLDKFAKKHNVVLDVVLKIDTGMNRLGFDIHTNYYELVKNYTNLRIVLVMTHLSSSDTDLEYTKWQINRFDGYLKKYNINAETSVFNSSAICFYSNKYTYTRPGIMSYGYVYPENRFGLKPVMSIFSKIIHIKKLKKGDKISYNQTYTAKKDMKIGVIPIGYADGYFRNLSNKGIMFINGKPCNVVGTVCMDMTMIDITHLNDSDLDSEVEILGKNIDAEQIAKMCGTISYEILCAVSDRIPRVYIND